MGKKPTSQQALAYVLVWLLFLSPLAGCQVKTALPAAPEATLTVTAASPPATQTLPPSKTDIPTTQPSQSPSPTSPVLTSVCSPMEGLGLPELAKAISNPYHPPARGKDDPHAGIDLADRSPSTQIALAGRGVQAALAGRAVSVIRDRFPFGNALIIETRLDALPADYLARLSLPDAQPPFEGPTALTCPKPDATPDWDQTDRSIYLLYAHLLAEPAVALGDPVTCGQPLGKVGSTGNALNPHLHLEARVGPSGGSFPSLAHYDNSVTSQEMGGYCLWAVSGIYQVFDPENIFK